MTPTEISAAIRGPHRRRCFAIKQRARLDAGLGAFIRLQLGWNKGLPDKDRKRIALEAARVIKAGTGEFSELIVGTKNAREPFKAIERAAEKQMVALAQLLPAWEAFGKAIRGFGARNLAIIVGEAGDLGGYATHSKLWKRMGLAVLDGVRQGGLSKGASADDWIAHGYNRQRRSRMWNVGDPLIKGNRDGVYRTCYLARKKFELERDPEMKPIKAHRRAQRYMEKRLLRDLWRAWRRPSCAPAERPMQPMAAASQNRPESQLAERPMRNAACEAGEAA